MSYHEQLTDRRWHERRNAIVNRDGNKCVVCGDTNKLEVHHGFYYPAWLKVPPWNYPEHSLWTLCHDCHSSQENQLLAIYKIIGTIHPALWREVMSAVSSLQGKDPREMFAESVLCGRCGGCHPEDSRGCNA